MAYSTHSATLELEHAYPKGTSVTALVDVQLLVSTLGSEQTRVGEWVNVIGYITSERPEKHPEKGNHRTDKILVQALCLWSAGPLDVHRYELALENNGSA